MIELAVVVAVLVFLLLGAIELGRSVFAAQLIQDAARVAAREIALIPLPADANGLTLDEIMRSPDPGLPGIRVRTVFDPCRLVVDLDAIPGGLSLDAYFQTLPPVNRMLRAAMIVDTVPEDGGGRRLLRYPGALLQANANCPGAEFTVGIPQVSYGGGRESVTWVEVVEEVPGGSCGPIPESEFAVRLNPDGELCGGLVVLRVNYPFQAGSVTGARNVPATSDDQLPPNVGNAIVADDGGVADAVNQPAFGSLFVPSDPDTAVVAGTAYAGRYGLGYQLALGQRVRPFRKLLSAQAVFRREIFQ